MRTERAVGIVPKRTVLRTADGSFMCKAEYALDVAFMLSCAEGLVVRHRGIDRYELGDLLFRYIDGEISTDEARKEIADWAEEMEEESAALAAALAPANGDSRA